MLQSNTIVELCYFFNIKSGIAARLTSRFVSGRRSFEDVDLRHARNSI